jgi:hypothetical protein
MSLRTLGRVPKEDRVIAGGVQSKSEARVTQKGEAEFGVGADAIETVFGDGRNLIDGVTAEVGKLTGLEVAEYLLGRIELRRVARQAFYRQPRALVIDPIGHAPTAMGRQAIPQQQHPAAGFELMQILEDSIKVSPL